MPEPVILGQLKTCDVRNVWRNEARDFTPWLAENLATLGGVLGMDLELQARESPVGSFSLDLLARDLGRDRLVVIENQLEATDHDHLGKLLTYAAGHDANVVVWVAKEIRDEHRQALDWLNQHTDRDIEFFAIVVEVVQIDDSRPACNFKLAAFPNEYRKAAIEAKEGGTSERREAYRAFFQELVDELREQHRFTGARVGQPQNWYSFASGISGITYSFVFAQRGQVRAEVYIDVGDASRNKAIFDAVKESREQIERELGEALQWERLDARQACRVGIYRDGSIGAAPQTLAEIRRWGVDRLLRFRRVFGPHLERVAR